MGLFSNLFSQKKLSENEFTDLYKTELGIRIEGIEFISVENLVIKTKKNGSEVAHYLDNAYTDYLQSPKELKDILKRYTSSAEDTYKETEAFSMADIVPRIKSRHYLDEVIGLTDQEEIPFIYEKLNEELYIFYGLDRDNSISYLTLKEFNDNNLVLDELRDIAVNNIHRIVNKIEAHGGEGFYFLAAGGDYEASLILDENIWIEQNFKVNGDFVFSVPSKDMLIITGSNDSENILKLKNIMTNVLDGGSHLISDKLFTIENGSILLYESN